MQNNIEKKNEVAETRTIMVGGKPVVIQLATEEEMARIRLLQFKLAYAKKNRK